MKHLFLLFLLQLSIVFSQKTTAQSPYQFELKKELTFFGTGALLNGLALYLETQTSPLTLNEIANLDPNNVNDFDRFATKKKSAAANTVSDYLWLSSFGGQVLLLATKKGHKHFGDIAVLYLQANLINGGLTAFSKFSFRRVRPLIYNEDIDIVEKEGKSGKLSFFSGHTSATATNTFFTAKIFSDLYPDSKWKPLVWTVAAAIPAATGLMRVQAGKHFPTDVIVGYVVGAGIGWLVPHLHRKKQFKEKGLSFYGGLNGMKVQLRF
jgi:membrane-associated phospholipid phosphatase